MKIKDIKAQEEKNDATIILHHEGMFYRAYEVSALLFYKNIAKFQVQKKYFKNIDSDMVYIGFPAQNLKILLEKAGVDCSYNEGAKTVSLCGFDSVTDFQEWKSSIPDTETQKQVQAELVRTQVDTTGIPDDMMHIYKMGFDLMVEIYKFTSTFNREYKFTVGESLKADAFDMALLCYRCALDKNRSQFHKVRDLIEKIRLRLRLLLTLNVISIKPYSRINTQIEYLYNFVIK